MIVAIQNTKTGIVHLMQCEPSDDLELEPHETIAAIHNESTDRDPRFNDDLYGSRPGENGYADYCGRTAYSESQSDLIDLHRNQY